MQNILKNADCEEKQKGYQKRNKYCKHTNENVAIGLFKSRYWKKYDKNYNGRKSYKKEVFSFKTTDWDGRACPA